MSYNALNADQRAGSSPNGKPSLTIDQAAAQLTRAGLSWSAAPGQATTVTYAYRSTAPSVMPGDTSGFSRLSSQQIYSVEQALRQWSLVANITFVRVGAPGSNSDSFSNDATILFGNYSSGEAGAAAFAILPGDRSSSSSTGDIWINSSYNDNRSPFQYGYLAILHEIGHAIGLLHPSDYDSEDDKFTYAVNAGYYEDSLEYSLMSYFGIGETGGVAVASTPIGPLIDDIAAAQRLYGPNMSAQSGNTIYAINEPIPENADYAAYIPASTLTQNGLGSYYAWGTIWDGGGIDTINGSEANGPSKIDLHAGSFSNMGSSIGTLSIAQGVLIENAIGSAYADTLIGNDADNVLAGNAGDDILIGGLGNDILFGGAGSDVAVIAAAFASAAFGVLDTNALQVRSSDGADQLFGIETIRFTDRSFAPTNLVPIDGQYVTWGGRHASSAELLYWDGQMGAGTGLTTIRSAILNDPFGRANVTARVTSQYETYFGRDPTVGEIGVWQGQIAGGADFSTVRSALVSDVAGQAFIGRSVDALYQSGLGRSARPEEIAVWQNQFKLGAESSSVRSAISRTDEAYQYSIDQIYASYNKYFGRSPFVSEAYYWSGIVHSGFELPQLKAALIADNSWINYSRQVIGSDYLLFFGRLPTSAELTTWRSLIAGDATVAGLHTALLVSPEGQGHTVARIQELYDYDLGRSATDAEVTYWKGRFEQTQSFAALQTALIADPAGRAHISPNITALYQKYAQRAPTASETQYWADSGDPYREYAVMRDRLMLTASADVVQHAVGTVGTDRFGFAGNEIAITIKGFTPGVDKVVLSAASFGSANPLAHVIEIQRYDIPYDTIVTLDPTHAVLFQDVHATDLTASDFIFV